MAEETKVQDAGTGSIDDFVKDAEPTRKTTKRTTTRRKPASRSRRDLEEPLKEFYASVGAGVFFISPADGALILEHGANCAEKLNELAKTNDAVYRMLDRLTTGGAMGAVLMAHAPIVLGIMQNHNVSVLSLLGKSEDGDGSDSKKGKTTGPSPEPGFSGDGVSTVGATPYVPPVVVEAR